MAQNPESSYSHALSVKFSSTEPLDLRKIHAHFCRINRQIVKAATGPDRDIVIIRWQYIKFDEAEENFVFMARPVCNGFYVRILTKFLVECMRKQVVINVLQIDADKVTVNHTLVKVLV